ncbi:MAG: DPP IV N-terminal domain-containing protein [Cyclobacteriaceae bacterium]
MQQLNRKQQESKIFSCNPLTGEAKQIFSETDNVWNCMCFHFLQIHMIDHHHSFIWLNGKKEFLWMSEKDWLDTFISNRKRWSKETLITKYDDVMDYLCTDEKKNNLIYLLDRLNTNPGFLIQNKT